VLIIDIIDDGPGISASNRNRVFEPFVRLSEDVSSAAGTGIGLSISRELARLHGGEVQLLDSVSGCHFVVTLHTS
jgi:signal transduction histidine kinase